MIGGRGPHGLATHLWMRDRGLVGTYALVDPAPDWLPLYDDRGPGRFSEHLRSPHELDFALGAPERSMRAWRDDDGQQSLAGAYGFADVADPHANASLPPERRVARRAFLRYARSVARSSGADEAVLHARVQHLEARPTGWTVELDDGRRFGTRVVLLATGLTPHLRVPEGWRAWWSRLPEDRAELALTADARTERVRGRRLAVLGSGNVGAWEAALWAARAGAHVTLLCRRGVPIERQLPFDDVWFRPDVIAAFGRLEPRERLRRLKRTHVPRSTMPGLPALVHAHGVRVACGARVQGATDLWGGVQVLWSDAHGDRAEHFDLVWAATGGDPRPRELPFLASAVGGGCGPVVVGGPARQLPVMDAFGRWKQLPPLYPLGHLALPRAGLAATTLASASRYLPTVLPHVLVDAGLTVSARAERRARDALEVSA